MRHFVERELVALKADGTIDGELIVQIATHSDNAAQHFKSSKSLCWYSSLVTAHPWIKSLVWDFGAPGHGKGVWDGLFGMLKQWSAAASLSESCAQAVPFLSSSAVDYF